MKLIAFTGGAPFSLARAPGCGGSRKDLPSCLLGEKLYEIGEILRLHSFITLTEAARAIWDIGRRRLRAVIVAGGVHRPA
jgi:hypothetical protein